MNQALVTLVVLMNTWFMVTLAMSQCPHPHDPICKDPRWRFGADRLGPGGVRVHGSAKFPIHNSPTHNVQGAVQGSRVFGGPHNGAQTVGGGANYQHSSGLHGTVGASHTRGQGNTFSAGVGGSSKVGPGTLSVGGNAVQYPGSSRVHGQVGATYTVPLP